MTALYSTSDLLTAYDGTLARRGRAPLTRVKYLHAVRTFLVATGGSIAEITSLDVEVFLSQWEAAWEVQTGRRPRPATVRARIAALRSFFDFAQRSALLSSSNPMEGVLTPASEQRPNDFLRPIEDTALLAADLPPQERLLIWLLRWTGLRVSEACAVRLQDLDLTPGRESVVVRKSKTPAGVRTIPLVPVLVPELEQWLSLLTDRGVTSAQAALLATRTGSAFKPTYVWRLVKRAGWRAEVRPVACTCDSGRRTRHHRGCPRTTSGENVSAITPHTLRRTFGSDLLNRGLRLEVVSRLLGHSSTVVTERAYAELLGSTIRDELLSVLGGERVLPS